MNERPEEISNIIKQQIRNYKARLEMRETGTVIIVGDGIAKVYGIQDCMSSELLEFDDGSFGMAQNLEEETVSVAILSNENNIREGTGVRRTGKVVSVPVGEALLGRVVNALGEPIARSRNWKFCQAVFRIFQATERAYNFPLCTSLRRPSSSRTRHLPRDER